MVRFNDIVGPTMSGINGASTLIDHDSALSRRLRRSVPTNGAFAESFTPSLRSPSATPSSPDLAPYHRLSPATSVMDGLSSEGGQSPQWSSAVGRATTGKSGRVIERLQAENDRLKRELKLETLRREEEQKKGDNARGQMESLQATNANLLQMWEGDKTSLARKERKVEELKLDLEGEKSRREEVEAQLKEVILAGEKTEEELKRQAREDSEKAKRSGTQYDVLSSSWHQMDQSYRRKTERLKADIEAMTLDGSRDRGKLDSLKIIIEQQRQEIEKMIVAKEGMSRQFDEFKDEVDESARSIREHALDNERRNSEALAETLKVLGEMKHIINVKKYVRGAE
ncbi:MAG: hypothetical protein M1817_002448 [Caeruleum heppii]|nr:MAG: hypothetical protein M1817_002448 [Caeruleum heppii]